MADILVCLLGGTIGSKTEKNVIKLGGGAIDKRFFDKIKTKSKFRYITPVIYSSENADIAQYKTALNGIVREAEENRPDGIMILHGTDSMAYFAQLAVRVLSFLNIPTVITGSKLPPDDTHSEAVSNVSFAVNLLEAAVEGRLGSKTFGVVFSDSFMGMSTFVPALKIMDSDIEGDYKKFTGKKDPSLPSESQARGFLSSSDTRRILTVPDVPGFPYDAVDLTKIDAVLIEAYHSGTQDSLKLPGFVKKASDSGVKCFIAPCVEKRSVYESENILEDVGVIKLSDMPLEGAWAEVVIGRYH